MLNLKRKSARDLDHSAGEDTAVLSHPDQWTLSNQHKKGLPGSAIARETRSENPHFFETVGLPHQVIASICGETERSKLQGLARPMLS